MARGSLHRALNVRRRGLGGRSELEQRCVRQRAQPDHATFGKRPEMPVAAVESFDFDIGHEHGLLVYRLAVEPHAKRFSHSTMAAVAPDQEVRSQYFTG
jgi:hypothetical protein